MGLLWLSAVDARVRLQGLLRDPRTSLQEHAVMVEKLTQITYGDLPPVNQERYTFDAFIQSLNDLLATQLCRSRVSSRQVNVD